MKIGIAITNYKRYDLLEECLKSIQNSSVQPYKIVIADNGVEEKDCPLVFSKDVIYLPEKIDAGFSSAANRAVRRLSEEGCVYILLICNDIKLKDNTIRALISGISYSQFQHGIVLDNKTDKIQSAVLNRHPLFLLPKSINSNIFVSSDYMPGCFSFFPAWFVTNYGIFDESLWSYCEDWDLALKIRKMGYEIFFNPYAVVYHNKDNSFNRDRSRRIYYLVRNTIRVVKSHKWGWYPYNLLFWKLIICPLIILRWPKYYKFVLLGIKDSK